jgi:hypothetical protein
MKGSFESKDVDVLGMEVDDATINQVVTNVLVSDVNAPKVRDEILPQHIKKLAIVVHKVVAETHEEANAHDAAKMEEEAKWMVTYSSMPTLLRGTQSSMNKLAFKLHLKEVLDYLMWHSNH